MSVAERLAYAVNLVPKVAWQDRFGRSPKQITRYLEGADVPLSVLTMVGAITGVPPSWIVDGRPSEPLPGSDDAREHSISGEATDLQGDSLGSSRSAGEVVGFRVRRGNPEAIGSHVRNPNPSPSSSFVQIPRYDVRAAAGAGQAAREEETLVGFLALEQDFARQVLRRPLQNLVSLRAEGDSMEPTIRDGDVLIIDTTITEVQSNHVYVLDVDGRLLVKRIQLRLDGSLLIRSDNNKYEPETVRPSGRVPLHIVGQVIYQAGPVRP